MKLIHYSSDAGLKLRSRRQGRECSGCFKPNGLWVSDEATEYSWSQWCESEDYDLGDFAFEVTLAPDANVLFIDRIEALLDFDKEYSYMPYPDASIYSLVDWKHVARAYHGIVITPYQWSQRFELHWYYGWDCASGCIWNKKAIERICAL